jgi:hypothetical protein
MVSQADRALHNRTLWDGRDRGFYEAYGLTLRHPETHHTLWLRFMLLASNEPKVKSTAEVWAMFFHATDPSKHQAWQTTVPLTEAEIARDEFHLRVDQCWISDHESRGQLQAPVGKLEWDLQFWSDQPCFSLFPYDWMYRGWWPRTKFLTPHPKALFNGIFQIDEEQFRCQHACGNQDHLWGSGHAHRWVKTHAIDFKDSTETELIAYSAELDLGALSLPAATIIHLRYHGENILFDSPYRWLTLHSRFEPFFWYFSARKGRRDFVGELSVNAANIIGSEFTDPDGSRIFCYNSPLANFSLKVYEKQGRHWVKVDQSQSNLATAYEYAQRTPMASAPIRLVAGKSTRKDE